MHGPVAGRKAVTPTDGLSALRSVLGATTPISQDPIEAMVRMPRTFNRHSVALYRFLTTPPRLACRHVVDGEYPLMCAQHPAAGLMCARCINRHTCRHDVAEEKTCDECRQQVDLIAPVAIWLPLVANPMDTKGRHRELRTQVVILAMGWCDPCKLTAGRDLDEAEQGLVDEGRAWLKSLDADQTVEWLERLGGVR